MCPGRRRAYARHVDVKALEFRTYRRRRAYARRELLQAGRAHHRALLVAQGNYNTDQNSDFLGFGRMGTGGDEFIGFNFLTYKPGKISENSSPHINLTLFARGMLNHLFTRIYFSDEENEIDEVLNQVDPLLRPRLIAEKVNEEEYYLDIILQGEKETIFFDI